MKRLLIAALALGAAACASTGGTGGPSVASPYSDEMISANRYKVTYTAPAEAKPADIANRTLARAAQLTLDKGNEWFEIAGKVDAPNAQSLIIVMGQGETLAGGKNKIYDAKETLASLKPKIG